RRNGRQGSGRRTVEKVAGYVVAHGRLLVLTHDDAPLHMTDVHVPAGSIGPGETTDHAVRRELREEHGEETRIFTHLDAAMYDVAPTRPEVGFGALLGEISAAFGQE